MRQTEAAASAARERDLATRAVETLQAEIENLRSALRREELQLATREQGASRLRALLPRVLMRRSAVPARALLWPSQLSGRHFVLRQRLEAADARNQELAVAMADATQPLLRQIEGLRKAHAARQQAGARRGRVRA